MILTRKYVAVLSFCAVFLFAIIFCCFFVFNDNVTASAQVVGDFYANTNYSICVADPSNYTQGGGQVPIVINNIDIFVNGNLVISAPFTHAQITVSSFAFWYTNPIDSTDKHYLSIRSNSMAYYVLDNGSWSLLYDTDNGMSLGYCSSTVNNFGTDVSNILGALRYVLTLAPSPLFTRGERYMLSYDFNFSSSDVITLGPCYISLFDNVDYVVYGSSYNIFSFDNITPSMAEFIINYDIDLDNRYVAIHWQQNDFIDRYVRVYPNGKMYIDLNGDIYQGYFDTSQFYIIPQGDNFSDVPSSADLSLLVDGLVLWTDFLSNDIGYVYSSSVVPYPVFNGGETTFEYDYVPFISLSLLDDGNFLNTYSEDLSFDNDCYGVVSTAAFGDGIIYSNVVKGSLLDPQVTSIGYTYNFGSSIDSLPVNYTYYLVYYDSDVYDPYLPVVRKQFRTTTFNHFWQLNYQNTLGDNIYFNDYISAVNQYYDKSSLVSVMFAVPDVVKSILVGSYDPNTNSYVNGLLTFEILGINLRDFFLSIITIIVLLKIVSFIIGRFGVA